MDSDKILEPIRQELKKLRARITFLEGRVFYNSIKKKVEKKLLEEYFELHECNRNNFMIARRNTLK